MNLTEHQLKLSSALYSDCFPKGEHESEVEHINRVTKIIYKHLTEHKMIQEEGLTRSGIEYLKDLLGPDRLFRCWIEIGKEN